MLRKKKIEGLSDLSLEPLSGTEEWYFCQECKESFCDLYEAEEIWKKTGSFSGANCYMIHYPDGKVHRPFAMKRNLYIERPVYDDGMIAFLCVDFDEQVIRIYHYKAEKELLVLLEELPLNMVKDCYNLSLKTRPLMLGRDGNEGKYEMIWPERQDIPMGEKEALMFRDYDKFYFSEWYENPEYHENVVIRDRKTGEVIERVPGGIYQMPNGTFWMI